MEASEFSEEEESVEDAPEDEPDFAGEADEFSAEAEDDASAEEVEIEFGSAEEEGEDADDI